MLVLKLKIKYNIVLIDLFIREEGFDLNSFPCMMMESCDNCSFKTSNNSCLCNKYNFVNNDI